MVSHLAFLSSLATAYLIGSFPTSYILARVTRGVDIRAVGSGNVGATNVLRSVGKLPAAVALIVDILKGVLVVTVLYRFSSSVVTYLDDDFYRALLGLVAICGHIWPVFLKFRGGKGVATTLGVSGVIAPMALAAALLVWVAVFYLTSYVSVASIALLVTFPILAIAFNYPFYTILFTVAVSAIGVYKHRENIQRLLKGTESKTKL